MIKRVGHVGSFGWAKSDERGTRQDAQKMKQFEFHRDATCLIRCPPSATRFQILAARPELFSGRRAEWIRVAGLPPQGF